jgi:hypothetical protein
MTREMKVYSSSVGWDRRVVAATTKKAAYEAMRFTAFEFNTYATETGSDYQIKVAMTEPGVAFMQSNARWHENGWWRVKDHYGEPWKRGIEPDIVVEK